MAQTLEHWIDRLQTEGRYTFLRQEAIADSGLSAEAVKKALHRLAKRQRIAKIKDYFYAIVPLEYQAAGAPPATWFVGDLMKAMKLPYYIGLLSAAAMHGAVPSAAPGIPSRHGSLGSLIDGRSCKTSILRQQVYRTRRHSRHESANRKSEGRHARNNGGGSHTILEIGGQSRQRRDRHFRDDSFAKPASAVGGGSQCG